MTMNSGTYRTVLLIVGAAVLVGIVVFTASRYYYGGAPSTISTSTYTQPTSIENFVTAMISDLSPVKEQVGGKYYVTKIEANGGAGTVEFEDGHNAYVADFTYSIDESGVPTVASFTIRQ